jgi:hypothetical protein
MSMTIESTVLVLNPHAPLVQAAELQWPEVDVPDPVVNSADKCRLGHISKQGSAVLRWVLGQAAPLATRADADLKRTYFAVLRRRGRPKAKVALARRLLVRLYVMLRDQIDYAEFCRRGAGASHLPPCRRGPNRHTQHVGLTGPVPVRAFSGSLMVHRDRLTDWDALPRRSPDRRRSKTTSCAASRARMDGWWTVTPSDRPFVVCLDSGAVLMDR